MRLRETKIVDTQLHQVPEIGQWLWALQDTRRRTLETLEYLLSPKLIDWLPSDNESSIGTILYHVAVIEADWLYVEVLEQSFPPQVVRLFPHDIREEQGRLTQIADDTLEQHLARLDVVRGLLVETYHQMDLTEFRRVRTLPDYDVTPEWVLHHLMQHEAEHRSQIGSIIRAGVDGGLLED